jgi:hypothetical protein
LANVPRHACPDEASGVCGDVEDGFGELRFGIVTRLDKVAEQAREIDLGRSLRNEILYLIELMWH